MLDEKKSDNEPPKIQPLPGYIEERYVKCGRLNCWCTNGKGHGPYYYRVYKTGNRKFKKYIKEEELAYFSLCIEERRQQVKETAEANRENREQYKALSQRLRENSRLLKSIAKLIRVDYE